MFERDLKCIKPKNFDEDRGIRGSFVVFIPIQFCTMNKIMYEKSVMQKFVVNCRIDAGKVICPANRNKVAPDGRIG